MTLGIGSHCIGSRFPIFILTQCRVSEGITLAAGFLSPSCIIENWPGLDIGKASADLLCCWDSDSFLSSSLKTTSSEREPLLPFVSRVQAMHHMKQVYQITTRFSKCESMFITLYEGGISVDRWENLLHLFKCTLVNSVIVPSFGIFLSVGHVEKVCYVDSV
jgi:hypothetical protein